MDSAPQNGSPERFKPVPGKPQGDLFGIPLRKLGWFACLLLGVASGFLAFFAATFLAILGLLVFNTAGHQIDYALTYRRVGMPVGLVVGLIALGYLGTLWSKEHLFSR